MPNHVINEIHAKPEVLKALLDDDLNVTFNMLIPSPAEDDPMFTCTRTEYGDGMVGYSMDGYSPLDWNRENWGTKWDAYNCDTSAVPEGILRFETAWAAPMPVFQKLIEKFPAERIELLWADEDLGSNLGHLLIESGNVAAVYLSDDDTFTRKQREGFACMMWEIDYNDWQAEIAAWS